MRLRLACLLAAALAFLVPVHAVAEPAASNAAARAVYLVSTGDFDAAREVLHKAVAGRRGEALHLAQLEGLILRKQGRLREAAEVFRLILSRDPNFTPARIELSRTLAEAGDADAALHQLQIIELGSNDPEIRRQARAYGENVKGRRPYGFSGYVSFLPSTNVNKGSGRGTFTVGGMEFKIDDDSREQSGWGVGTGANAYRTFHVDEATRLSASGAIDLKKYSGGTDFDELAGSANLSLARRFGNIELQAGPTVDYRLLGWEPYAWRYGLAASAVVDVATHTRLYSGGTLLKQNFESTSYRDGWVFLGYAGVRHALSPSLALSVTANFSVERTRLEHLDHNDARLVAQVDREWRGGLVTSFATSVGYHDYRGDFPGTDVARRDNNWSAGMTMANRNWSLRGFAPQLKYEYTRQQSNVSFYDYDSHDVDLTFTKLF
jgi:tetratricopeptide (TPR) repeat protein